MGNSGTASTREDLSAVVAPAAEVLVFVLFPRSFRVLELFECCRVGSDRLDRFPLLIRLLWINLVSQFREKLRGLTGRLLPSFLSRLQNRRSELFSPCLRELPFLRSLATLYHW